MVVTHAALRGIVERSSRGRSRAKHGCAKPLRERRRKPRAERHEGPSHHFETYSTLKDSHNAALGYG